MSRDEENVRSAIQEASASDRMKSGCWSAQQEPAVKVPLSSATRPAGQFKCVGAIRKAGFLSVKKWILKRKQSIELARKQGWKRYWVCLRGTTLLFYSVVDRGDPPSGLVGGPLELTNRTCLLDWIQSNCSNQQMTNFAPNESLAQCYIEKEPRHLIIIEGAIAQPIPEHPKRDFVFCLSTTFGDAYLFQSACQLESDNWIAAIHNACAASIARDLTRDEATKLFENRIRHLEIEAEKKLFLRQRLESRLTSMSSMGHISVDLDSSLAAASKEGSKTMRSLLFRLNQQLLALDTYIEQVHCEIYQLHCYIASCNNQRKFYQQMACKQQLPSSLAPVGGMSLMDLPHPKALLMYVSKPTKLILIKLGVFTVSSFHAYIHARQGSAESILQRIHTTTKTTTATTTTDEQSPTVELRVRSRSLSEQMVSNRLLENVQLEDETEKLIDMSDFTQITIRLSKLLYEKIKSSSSSSSGGNKTNDDYDTFSSGQIKDSGQIVLVEMRIHPSSNTLKIIQKLLNIIEPNLPEMDFLNYYLRFDVHQQEAADKDKGDNDNNNNNNNTGDDENDDLNARETRFVVVKRTEKIADWTATVHEDRGPIACLELVEKIIFRLDLLRRQVEEESTPFGISIGVQLFEGKIESLLSVHCSYIEWGSVADKAGLRDDDELLVINGVPVMDLDMMFVESLIQDDARLRLVVRSSRLESPSSSSALDSHDWRQLPPGGSSNQEEAESNCPGRTSQQKVRPGPGTQVISDEYISSLVCPPPPDKSGAFLRADSTLLRQKSDMTAGDLRKRCNQSIKQTADLTEHTNQTVDSRMVKAKSQHNIDSSLMGDDLATESASDVGRNHLPSGLFSGESQQHIEIVSSNLASQLIRKTGQLNRLLEKTVVDEVRQPVVDGEIQQEESNDGRVVEVDRGPRAEPEPEPKLPPTPAVADELKNPNALERLRKSILELIETEFAYIRHLETISEHYMSPLGEMSFLSIADLKHLHEIVSRLIQFQREFFDKLARGLLPLDASSSETTVDEYEELNRIVQHLDSLQWSADFSQILKLISQTFLDEAEKFKIYSAYCATYSRLQKLLHPKRSLKVAPSATIIATPNALDTFLLSDRTNSNSSSTSAFQIGAGGGASQVGGGSRDFLKPLGSFMGTSSSNNPQLNNPVTNASESKSQLKQLNDFLGHLDSSSSSVSLSLPKSSSGSGNNQQKLSTNSTSTSTTTTTTTTTADKHEQPTTAGTFQKSAHQQSFESYLIKPIQRIVKYPMLLNSIAASAAQASASAKLHEDLQKAVKQMESITSHVNDTQRVHDEFGSIFDLIERQFLKQVGDPLIGQNQKPASISPHQPAIGLGIDQLLHFGQVDWLNIVEFNAKMRRPSNCGNLLSHHLFVFNSCVVFVCKELVQKPSPAAAAESASNRKKVATLSTFNGQLQRASDSAEIIRYQSLIPVSEVQVRSVPTTNNQSRSRYKYQWELFRCSSVNSNSSLLTKTSKRAGNTTNTTANDGKVYLLASPTNEARNLFLRKIRYTIRESVRNMSLPFTRSPSSKSLSPKKLSSTSTTNTNSSCSQSTSLSPVIHRDEERKFIERDETSNYVASIKVNN